MSRTQFATARSQLDPDPPVLPRGPGIVVRDPVRCSCCEEVPAVVLCWVQFGPETATHPLYPSLCSKCMEAVRDLLFYPLAGREVFLEGVAPYHIEFPKPERQDPGIGWGV